MYRMGIFILVGRERENERERLGEEGIDGWIDGTEREARKRGGMDGWIG